jgi:hypothetical protein
MIFLTYKHPPVQSNTKNTICKVSSLKQAGRTANGKRRGREGKKEGGVSFGIHTTVNIENLSYLVQWLTPTHNQKRKYLYIACMLPTYLPTTTRKKENANEIMNVI